MQSEVRLWTKKFEDMGREMDNLKDLKKTVSELQKEIETLINRNKVSTCMLPTSFSDDSLLRNNRDVS